MKPEIVKQVQELLRDAKTEEELAEISAVLEEAKGKVRVAEQDMGFWTGKSACWEMFRCPPEVRSECAAPKNPTTPCWQIEGTYCKLFEYGMKGDGTQICESCRVYKKYGQGVPIQIRLFGQGFNPAAEATTEAKQKLQAQARLRTETLRIGDTVWVRECTARPELVGARGQVMQMQTQQFEKHCIRPIWVKITSGPGEGRTYGFWERELEIVSVG